MDILQQLGINEFSLVQLLIFSLSIAFLSKFVFSDYFLKYEERILKTKGGEDLAQELHLQSQELMLNYETKARELNQQIKGIIDSQKNVAMKDYDKAVAEAKLKANQIVLENKHAVEKNIREAQQDLSNKVPELAQMIVEKVVGKA